LLPVRERERNKGHIDGQMGEEEIGTWKSTELNKNREREGEGEGEGEGERERERESFFLKKKPTKFRYLEVP
jgi:hypothetical protein